MKVTRYDAAGKIIGRAAAPCRRLVLEAETAPEAATSDDTRKLDALYVLLAGAEEATAAEANVAFCLWCHDAPDPKHHPAGQTQHVH